MFEAHGPMVFGLCKLLLRDRHEAEDALQQTFLSGYRSMLDGTDPEEPSAWLAAIARNECRSRLRRRAPEPVLLYEDDLGSNEDVADVVDRRTELAALSEAIAGLTPPQRQALILRDFRGLSYREVSAALGVTRPAVESLLFRSRKRLQERLQPFHAVGGVAALPIAVRDALVRTIPGFSSGLTPTGVAAAGAGVSAKLVSTSAGAKIAALALAAGLGTVTVVHQSVWSHRHTVKALVPARLAVQAPRPSPRSRPNGREQIHADRAPVVPSARVNHVSPGVERWRSTPTARLTLPAAVGGSSPAQRVLSRPVGEATSITGESIGLTPATAHVVPARRAGDSSVGGFSAQGAEPISKAPADSGTSSAPTITTPVESSSPSGQGNSGDRYAEHTSGQEDGGGLHTSGSSLGGEGRYTGNGFQQTSSTAPYRSTGDGGGTSSSGGDSTATVVTTTPGSTTSSDTAAPSTSAESYGGDGHWNGAGGSTGEASGGWRTATNSGSSSGTGTGTGTGGSSDTWSGGGDTNNTNNTTTTTTTTTTATTTNNTTTTTTTSSNGSTDPTTSTTSASADNWSSTGFSGDGRNAYSGGSTD